MEGLPLMYEPLELPCQKVAPPWDKSITENIPEDSIVVSCGQCKNWTLYHIGNTVGNRFKIVCPVCGLEDIITREEENYE